MRKFITARLVNDFYMCAICNAAGENPRITSSLEMIRHAFTHGVCLAQKPSNQQAAGSRHGTAYQYRPVPLPINEYLVMESIIGVNLNRQLNVWEYRVKWLNFDEDEATWDILEDAAHIPWTTEALRQLYANTMEVIYLLSTQNEQLRD